tara:strand:- start:243 stop:692 length:450 start_codon:yes stop_codon:yes gene_type:complete
MENKLVKKILDHIKEYEGYSNVLYKCTSNKWTIGYGRNLQDVGISKDEAEYMLNNDVDIAIQELEDNFDLWNLPEAAQIVLVDMCYNLGLTKLLEFKLMLKAIQDDDWQEAAHQLMSSKYASQVKRRARFNAALLLSCEQDDSDHGCFL